MSELDRARLDEILLLAGVVSERAREAILGAVGALAEACLARGRAEGVREMNDMLERSM